MISIIGAGKWGQALHFAIKENGFQANITSRTKKDIKEFVSLDEALNSQYLIITIPSFAITNWLKKYFVNKNQKILVASKGIEENSLKFLNEIYADFIDEDNIAFLSGPSFAAEVKQKLPTAVVINSKNQSLYNEFSKFFPPFIKTYYSDDIIGAEIAGAYKNVLAIASGICAGLQLGNNAKAALLARGLIEMSRFGKFFGAKDESFLGLSGAGDLFLTANSTLSRNYRVGLGLANNQPLAQILQDLGEVAEGIKTSYAINKLSHKYNIYTPIVNEVVQILDGKNPLISLTQIMHTNS
jgi:glycerol-3-phosphate dehydrogenase (NAD(P)+)